MYVHCTHLGHVTKTILTLLFPYTKEFSWSILVSEKFEKPFLDNTVWLNEQSKENWTQNTHIINKFILAPK